MSNVDLNNYEQHPLAAPDVSKLPVEEPVKQTLLEPTAPIGVNAPGYDRMGRSDQPWLRQQTYSTAFNSEPKNIQDSAEQWVRNNPNLANDPTALMNLSRETGIPQSKLHSIVSWAALNPTTNWLHMLGNFTKKIGEAVPGAIGVLGPEALNFFPGFAAGQASINEGNIERQSRWAPYGEKLYADEGRKVSKAAINRAALKQLNDPNYQTYRQEEARSNFYTANAGKDWHALWHDTAGQLMNIATSTFHFPGFVVSDYYKNGAGAAAGDIGSAIIQMLLLHKLGVENLPEETPVADYADTARKTVDKFEQKVRDGVKNTFEEFEAYKQAVKFLEWSRNAKARIEEHPVLEKLGSAIGTLMSPARIAYQDFNKIANNNYAILAQFLTGQEQSTFNRQLWDATMSGAVIGPDGQPETMTTWVSDELHMQNSFLFHQFKIKGPGGIGFQGGAIELYQYLFQHDPFAAVGKMRKIARGKYGFTGHLQRWFGGTGLRRPGDAYRAYEQLQGVRDAVNVLAEAKTPGKVLLEFPNQFGRKIAEAFAKANTPEAVLSIFEDVTLAQEVMMHQMPFMSTFSLWKRALAGDLGERFGIVGNILNRTYEAKVYEQLKEQGIDLAPQSFVEENLGVGDKASNGFRKMIARQFLARAQYYSSKLRAFENREIFPNDIQSLPFIKDTFISGGMDPRAADITVDLLFYTTDASQWNRTIFNATKELVLSHPTAAIVTDDIAHIMEPVRAQFNDMVWNLLGADGGNTEGAYNFGAKDMVVKTPFGPKNVAVNESQLGHVRMFDARTIKGLARTTAKWLAQLEGSAYDHAFKTILSKDKQLQETLADLAKVKVKNVLADIREHWSQYSNEVISIHVTEHARNAYLAKMEEMLTRLQETISVPISSDLNEAQRFSLVVDEIQKEIEKIGNLKMQIDKGLAWRRNALFEESIGYESALKKSYVEGEELSSEDMKRLQEILLAENQAVRFMHMKMQDVVSEQFDSEANLRKMSAIAEAIADDKNVATAEINRNFAEFYKQAKLGKVYIAREIKTAALKVMRVLANPQETAERVRESTADLRAVINKYAHKENPYKAILEQSDQFVEQISEDFEMQERYAEYYKRLDKLGVIGRNVDAEVLQDEERLQEFLDLAEKDAKKAARQIQAERSVRDRKGLYSRRNYRNNREIVTDAINRAINTPFKVLALAAISWSTHVSMSEYMVNSLRVGGDNMFNARFAFQAARWEYRFGKLEEGEKSLLLNTIGVLFHGIKKGLLSSMDEVAKNNLMEDAFWLMMAEDGHFQMGVHGHSTNVDQEAVDRNESMKVFGIDPKDEKVKSSYKFVTPEWTKVSTADDNYASAYFDAAKLRASDPLQGPLVRMLHAMVMQEGLDIIGSSEETAVSSIIRAAQHIAENGEKSWVIDRGEKEINRILQELSAREEFQVLTASKKDELIKELRTQIIRTPEQITIDQMTDAAREAYETSSNFIAEHEEKLNEFNVRQTMDLYRLRKALLEAVPEAGMGNVSPVIRKMVEPLVGPGATGPEIMRVLEEDKSNPLLKEARRMLALNRAQERLSNAERLVQAAKAARDEHPYNLQAKLVREEERMDFARNMSSEIKSQLQTIVGNRRAELKSMLRGPGKRIYKDDIELLDYIDPAIVEGHVSFHSEAPVWKDVAYAQKEIRPDDERIPRPISFNGYGHLEPAETWNSSIPTYEQKINEMLKGTQYPTYKINDAQFVASLEKAIYDLPRAIQEEIEDSYSWKAVEQSPKIKKLVKTILPGMGITRRNPDVFLRNLIDEFKSSSTLETVKSWATYTKRIKPNEWEKLRDWERRDLIAEYGQEIKTADDIHSVTTEALRKLNSNSDDFTGLTEAGKILSAFKIDSKRFTDKMDVINSGEGLKRWKSLLHWRDINLDTVLNAKKLSREDWGQRVGREFENRYNTYKSPLFDKEDPKAYTPDDAGRERFIADFKRYSQANGPWVRRYVTDRDTALGYTSPRNYFNNEMVKHVKASDRRRLAKDWAIKDEAYKAARTAAQRSRERISKLLGEETVNLDPETAGLLEEYRTAFKKYEESSRLANNLAESMRKARDARDRAARQTFERINKRIQDRIEGIESEYGRLIKRSPEQVLEEARRRANGEQLRSGWSEEPKMSFMKMGPFADLIKAGPELVMDPNDVEVMGGYLNGGFFTVKNPATKEEYYVKMPIERQGDSEAILERVRKNAIDSKDFFLNEVFDQLKDKHNVEDSAQISELVSLVAEALDAPAIDTRQVKFYNDAGAEHGVGILMPKLKNWDSANFGGHPIEWLEDNLQIMRNFYAGDDMIDYVVPKEVSDLAAQEYYKLLILDHVVMNADRHGGNVLINPSDGEFVAIDHDNAYTQNWNVQMLSHLGNLAENIGEIFLVKTESGEYLFDAANIVAMDKELKNLYKYGEMNELQRSLLEFSLNGIWDSAMHNLSDVLDGIPEFAPIIEGIKDGSFPFPVEQPVPMVRPVNALREAMMQDLNDKQIMDRFGGSPFGKHRTAGVDALERMYGDRIKIENDRIAAAYDDASKQVAMTLGSRAFSGAEKRQALYDSFHAQVEAYLRKMGKKKLERFERSFSTLVDETLKSPSNDPMVDFATTLTHDLMNAIYSNVNDKMIPEVLQQMGTNEFTSAKDWAEMVNRMIKNSEEGTDAVPHNVPARQTTSWMAGAMKNLLPEMSQRLHQHVLGPIVNEMVRSPLYLVEFHNQMNFFRPLIADGILDEEVARVQAQINAAISMERYVHNPMGKTNFEHNMRVLAPFYFAKNQAIRRAFRMGAKDIGAIDRYLRMNLFMTNFIGTTNQNGNNAIAIPGSEMFGTISTSLAAMAGYMSGVSAMPGEAMQMGFNGSAGSVNSMIITGNQAGAAQILENFIRVPWGPVVVLPAKFYYEYVTHHSETVRHVLNAILGPDAMNTSFMSDLMPNSFVRNVSAIAANAFGDPVGSYMSMQNQIGSTVGGEMWQQFYEQTIQENPYASGLTQRYITDQKWAQYWGAHKADINNNVSWMTAIAYGWKTLVSEVSPLTVSFNNTWSDSNIYNKMQSERNPDGTLKYPDLTTLFNAFVTEHPGHIFDIVSKTQSPYGVWPEVNASLKLIDGHQTQVLQVPYGSAYLVPRTLDSKYSATALQTLIGVGLRQHENWSAFSDAMMIAIGDDMYYNILQPEYRQNYPDGQGGINFAGQNVLKHELQVFAEINPTWYNLHVSATRSNLAVSVYNDMDKMVSDARYHDLFSNGEQLGMFEMFVNTRKEYIAAFNETLPAQRGRLRTAWYNVTTEWYNNPQYAGYQSFISLMRKLPDPA